MDAFYAVTALFHDKDRLVVAANRIGKAYADGIGHPEFYVPYGVDEPEQVAIDLAGLFAADTAANIVATCTFLAPSSGDLTKHYVRALGAIASGDVSRRERYIIANAANLAWRTSQPFRDLATNPLGRLTRLINSQFNLLSTEEIDKDLVQVQEGAKILLEVVLVASKKNKAA